MTRTDAREAVRRASSDALAVMTELKRIAVSIQPQLTTLGGAIVAVQEVAADEANADLTDTTEIAEWKQFVADVSAALAVPDVAAALATLSGG